MTAATTIDIENTQTLVCDVMDVYPDAVRLLDPIFRDYGGKKAFHGQALTIHSVEDNVKIWDTLSQPGLGRVLVVDGGGSLRHSLFGGNLAQKAYENGWAGVIIHGCTRDVAEQRNIPIGIKALAACPRRAKKEGIGEIGVPVTFAGQTIKAGEYIYADEDGIIVASEKCHDRP